MSHEMSNLYGWTGKILSVDLTKRKISMLQTQDYSERFIGGLGIAQKIYWDQSLPENNAFHPDSPLIMMTGPLTATMAPSAPRLVVCGKSPCIYPETFVSASIGGFFPADLKKAGYDGIVIKGRADKPVYLRIDNDSVSIQDARNLWGLTNSKTCQIIQQENGKNARVMSIGPCAENGSRIGTVFSDLAGSASMGFGSVMGSKNLKAIAVNGTGKIPVADPEKIRAIKKKLRSMTGEGYYHLYGEPIIAPGTKIVKKVHCHGCAQGCWRTLQRNSSGKEGIRKCQTGMYYAKWDKQRHNRITDTSFFATDLANDYSLCILELLFIMLWIERCVEKGILTEKETGLPLSRMGSREFIETMIKKISCQEGFGKVLGEGTLRASEIMGKESREVTRNFLHHTGRGVAYGPKVFILSALIYATEPRPSITELHEVCEPLTKWALWYTSRGEKTYVSTDILRKIGRRFWGSEQSVDFSTYEGKALASKLVQDRQFVKESMIMCDFAWPVYDDAGAEDHVGDPALESQLLSAVTGLEIDEKELARTAERIFTLNRAILLREGRKGRQDDVLPEFFFVEREELIGDVFGMNNPDLLLPGSGDEVISRKGKAVDREKFEKMKDEYYDLRGWDVKTGLLKKDTLNRLDLNDLIELLKEKVI